MTKRIRVTYPGNAASSATFGGTPYFVAQALRTALPDVDGLDLPLGVSHVGRRYLWNTREFIMGRGIGGYQYSDTFLEHLWRNAPTFESGDIIVNLFQLHAMSYQSRTRADFIFYLDQTLRQLFAAGKGFFAPRGLHAALALAKEQLLFDRAARIVCRSEWAARSVQHDYGIAPSKIVVATPGANVDDGHIDSILSHQPVTNLPSRFSHTDPLTILFVGKDPVRKGLFRLLDGVTALGTDASAISVVVIGTSSQMAPTRYRNHPNVIWRGFINKSEQFNLFRQTMEASHLGALLSTVEAAGLSIREFQLFGLGVIAPKVGGSPEMLAPGAGILIDPSADADAIAAELRSLLSDPDHVVAMRAAATSARAQMTWRYRAAPLVKALVAVSPS